MKALISNRLTFGDGHHHAMNHVKMEIRDLNVWYDYGSRHALKNVSLTIYGREVTAFIGPSGCGKSTLLKCLNRINETIPGVTITGDILLDGMSIHDKAIEACKLRRRFGWVAQQPNPFPRSVTRMWPMARASTASSPSARTWTTSSKAACVRQASGTK